MNVAIVASSKPARGNHPIVIQEPRLSWNERNELVCIKFVETGFLSRSRELSFFDDIQAVSPVPEDIIKPYGVEAAKRFALNTIEALVIGRIPLVGGLMANSMGNTAVWYTERTALAGCALVYKNSKDALVAALLCGLATEIAKVIYAVPEARRSEQLPPPFSFELLAKISEGHVRRDTYDY